ncbi:hypothetical protein PhaeoP83_00625 [Phaeobacter inhibens]|uniref:DUF3618 domain-containing protein n=1 Tax=Phaeobacter inhibens TaxID=221822 RepID=A0ABN5GJ62_9RHOB|nr:hypothetical protein [Phaeobacter inhibens]AUQ48934.1 hypothetical protein PhaeoP83_00625 [Phaeobacter inhibens]AUQ93434.1 hypothetical protein PhaeoP66_00618 [Phaeobacter inhibens]AUR18737.1 hypothetical protein PhaeoP80_00625 [Phaeobacter inhibens]
MPETSELTDLESDVARDRVALSKSLDTLAVSLSPDRIATQVSATASHYGGEISQQLLSTARANPAALALVGTGIALLMSGAGQRREPGPRPQPDAPTRTPATPTVQPVASKGPSAKRLRAALDHGLDRLPPKARKQIRKARLAAIHIQEDLERRAAKLSRASQEGVAAQPLVAGGLAFGLGAIAAALLPQTRQEDALLGEKRDALMAEARDILQQEMRSLANKGETALHEQVSKGRDALHASLN